MKYLLSKNSMSKLFTIVKFDFSYEGRVGFLRVNITLILTFIHQMYNI